MISVNDAAKRLKVSPQQVRNLCRTNKIKCQKLGNSWVIDSIDLENYFDNSHCGVAEDSVNYFPKSGKKPIALSFFSGAMGMDQGLEKAGFQTILASEIDNACRKTIMKNKPDIGLIGDIRDYTPEEIRKIAGLSIDDEIDLVVGGPPCQAFSTAGKRKGFEDERGNVFLTFIETLIALKPKYAVIENVRGLLSAPLVHRPHSKRGTDFAPLSEDEMPGGALHHIIDQLRQNGYGVSFNLYNAANFGTPQKRERVIIICSRDGKKLPYLPPTHSETGDHGLPKWKTFREATKVITAQDKHDYINFPEKRLKYYRHLKAGQNWRALSPKMQKEAMGASYFSGGGKTGFLRRLSWDAPSPTLLTHPAMPATDLCHPDLNRPLSIQEYKVIQEFPSKWKIEGSILEKYKQIGNAVPVGLGYAVGNLLIRIMNGESVDTIPDFKYSRYLYTDESSWYENFLLQSKKGRQVA